VFARAVEALLADPDRRGRMAEAAGRYVAGQRSLDQAAEALHTALRDARAIRAGRS
jgi:hypothetical protein